MKKILLICNYFAPENTIAAVRISKFAKYLTKYGFQVDCITEKKESYFEDNLLKDDISGIKILYASNSKVFLRFEKVFNKLMEPFKKKGFYNLSNRKRVNPKTGYIEFYPYETAYPFLGSIEYLVGQFRQIDLYRSVKKYLKKAKKYDYLITSYGDSFSYFSGRYFHKFHKKSTWIFDIRDAVYRYKFVPSYVRLIPISYEKYIWKNADGIIGVSKGICRRVPKKHKKKVYCITNGYDWADRNKADKRKNEDDKLMFAFTGSMYGGLMDLSVFFHAINSLIQKKVIAQDKIEFHFAGNFSAYEIFHCQAAKYSLGDCCINHGKLPRRDAMALQCYSDILLSASYDYKENEGGVITGKIFEYMTSGCPVISVITGNIDNSELADIVRRTNIGIAYEQSNHNRDYKRLLQYLEMQYKEKIQNRKVWYQPDETELKKYDYQVLTIKLINVMEKLRKY